ncbi:MAG: 16S rRNA (cytosine(967)-C(5))-methyltransferase RsmB [Magnetococcales bacterium]|nr:16S rRNA (cytosine(967)-C(5))-methyltransferase RsmB [Magnetococcales bacterium]
MNGLQEKSAATGRGSPRLLAVQAVMGVLRDATALELPPAAGALAPRDRAMALEIAAGTVRHLATLDHLLTACMERPLEQKHRFLWAVLRTALYQALYMRVPERAAVYEAVALLKESREANRAGFANAVLRSALRLDQTALLAQIADPVRRLAVSFSFPEWLVRRWWERLGEAATRERLAASNQVAPLTLRTNTLATQPETLRAALGERATPCRLAPEGIWLQEMTGPVEKIPGYGNGWFAVQDQAAQLVSHFLAPQAGERVLDACAAPGGKTTHLAALAGDALTLTAVEQDAERIPRLHQNLHRLRVQQVEVLQGDAGDPALLGERSFDRALLDVPCTGTGVLRRHPEIKWRRSADDVARMARIQARLLTGVAARVVVGGWLVYATCSLEPEENQEQIEAFLQQHPGWCRRPITMAGVPVTPQGDFHSEPGEQGMDGFYAARLQRVA